MAQKNSSIDSLAPFFWGAIFLALALYWLTIPTAETITGLHTASLAFANGIFVGWADNIAAWLLTDTEQDRLFALKKFRDAILIGERESPVLVAVFVLFGTLLSIGGVIAVWMARSAASLGAAFRLGFFAEIAEGVAYNVGYYATTGKSGVSTEEAGITLIVALFMGIVAIFVFRRARK